MGMTFKINLALAMVCLLGVKAEVEGDYKLLISRYLNDRVRNDDLYTNLDEASKWMETLSSKSEVGQDVIKIHVRFMRMRSMLENPKCGLDEAEELVWLKKLRGAEAEEDYDERDISRAEILIEKIQKEHADKCRSIQASRIMNFLDGFESKTKFNLLKLGEAQRNRLNWRSDDLIVDAAYKVLSSHTRDPLISAILPETSAKPLTLKQYDMLYTKYVSGICKDFQDSSDELWKTVRVEPSIKRFEPNYDKNSPHKILFSIREACDIVVNNCYLKERCIISDQWVNKVGNLRNAVKSKIETITRKKMSTWSFWKS